MNGFISGQRKSFAPMSPLFQLFSNHPSTDNSRRACDSHRRPSIEPTLSHRHGQKRTSRAIIARMKQPFRCSHQRNHEPWEELEARIIVRGHAWFNSISINTVSVCSCASTLKNNYSSPTRTALLPPALHNVREIN